MYSLYDQLQKERSDEYDNGLYYIYKYNIFSTINNLFSINLSSFQINMFIENDIIPTYIKHIPLPKSLSSKIPRKLILISNRYTPDWILDHIDDELSLENLCKIHKQITFLPLRDIFRINTWSGKILNHKKEVILSEIHSIKYSCVMDWYKNIVPAYRKQRPFKHGNALLLYVLFIKECLKRDLFPPILTSKHLKTEPDANLLSDVELAITKSNSDISDLRY